MVAPKLSQKVSEEKIDTSKYASNATLEKEEKNIETNRSGPAFKSADKKITQVGKSKYVGLVHPQKLHLDRKGADSMMSLDRDQEDDYQDIDEKSIQEPNYLGRQQVYVNLDKDDSDIIPHLNVDNKKLSPFKHENIRNRYLNLDTRFKNEDSLRQLSVDSDFKHINKTL